MDKKPAKAVIPRSRLSLMKDSLAGNSIVAFMGSLLLAQSPSPNHWVLGITVFLAVLSVILALASIVSRLSERVLDLTRPLAPVLALFTWLGFTSGWISAIVELPEDQWQSHVLAWSGLGMFIFLFGRFMLEIFRSGSRAQG